MGHCVVSITPCNRATPGSDGGLASAGRPWLTSANPGGAAATAALGSPGAGDWLCLFHEGTGIPVGLVGPLAGPWIESGTEGIELGRAGMDTGTGGIDWACLPGAVEEEFCAAVASQAGALGARGAGG